jgi:hypothetical protein
MKIKYATRAQLIKINNRAIAKNYNRAVKPEFLQTLPEFLRYPVTLTLLHEHAQGQPVAPHMRCRFTIGDENLKNIDAIMIDVEMDLYDMLPEIETETTKATKRPRATQN